jgi:hypothetical protein
MFIKLRYRIKSITTGLKNLWKWRKIIYKDRDWDQYYIFEILKTKLKFQNEHFYKYGNHVSSERDAEKMELCVKLIDKVQNEYYLDEALGKNLNDMDGETIANAINKHNKAKKLLFKILEENIERWWN